MEMTKEDYARVFTLLKDEWDRCMAIQLERGSTHEEAAAIVGAQMTEWFNGWKVSR